MKLYFAGPLFTTPERIWNAEVTSALRAAGHEVFLPQEQEPGMNGEGIFATDVGGVDWADGPIAINGRTGSRLGDGRTGHFGEPGVVRDGYLRGSIRRTPDGQPDRRPGGLRRHGSFRCRGGSARRRPAEYGEAPSVGPAGALSPPTVCTRPSFAIDPGR